MESMKQKTIQLNWKYLLKPQNSFKRRWSIEQFTFMKIYVICKKGLFETKGILKECKII